ncbi:MAG: hypothetical protein DI535_19880 [Citrobacter freundii]|nr:MAG: hypothetical protein DI535_19880 [Citrobacter freundii]
MGQTGPFIRCHKMRAVDDYIDALPDERRVICEKIRDMIFSLVPAVEERFSFKIPFYHYFGMFLYLSNTADGIAVSFCRGKDLVDLFPELSSNGRTIVASVCISTTAEIYSKQLQEIILTAAAWNQEAKMLKIPMVKTGKKKSDDPKVAARKKAGTKPAAKKK